MKIPSIKPNLHLTFKSQTAYYMNKVVEEDITTLEESKSYFSNPISPNQDFVGINLIRENDKTIHLKSRYNNIIGKINYNSEANLPKINVITGSHQPVVELVDEELGIKILLNRGSNVISKNLNISYKNLNEKKIYVDSNKNISFGNNLYVVSGYKSKNTEQTVSSYIENNKGAEVPKSVYASLLSNKYSIFTLAAGYGTRLKPISDLTNSNKPTTKFPNTDKTFMELSALDTAARAGNIRKCILIKEDENNLSGTAGPIIKGLKNGTIPIDKPLVLLTSDTFNNIDLAQALRTYEESGNTGIGVVVREVSNENLFGTPLIKFNSAKEIEKFYHKIDQDNYRQIINENDKFYTSTNIMIINPRILEILKKFGDKNNNADFLEFLGLMFNVMNKSYTDLNQTYPYGLGDKELSINDLTWSYGYPKSIYDKESGQTLKVNAIVARDIRGENPHFADIGTIEKFIETVKNIKQSKYISGLNSEFVKNIQNSVNSDGVIFMDANGKDALENFKRKYNIKELSGNVIVSALPQRETNYKAVPPISKYTELAKGSPDEFVKEVMKTPAELKNISKEMIKDMGVDKFLEWYLSEDGYYGAYEKYVEKLYLKSESLDDLLKFSPNWSPWKLEEKAWRLDNTWCKEWEPHYVSKVFVKETANLREYPFKIGELPRYYFSSQSYEDLVSEIREENVEDDYVYISGYNYHVKKLKGGELNDKNIYLISFSDKKFILKMDRSYAEDSGLYEYDKKVIKKNKTLMADSNFTNACISRYLELNGCKSIPKLYYYDYKTDSALYEYIEDVDGDLFQKGVIDTEYSDLNLSNEVTEALRKKGIYLNDTARKNFLKTLDGHDKIIDLGHSNFIMPFKPGVKHYNIEFSNINGPDTRAIYAGLL